MNIANNKHFHYRTNSVKLMTKFFFKFKKPYFSTTFDPFPQFWGKKNFLKNWAVVHIRVSGTMPKFREISWSNSKKTPTQVSGGKDGKTLFHSVLPATARGHKYNCSRLTFKIKDIEYDAGLTKNYSITVSMKKISSIHKHT